jgi:hypothetical protein
MTAIAAPLPRQPHDYAMAKRRDLDFAAKLKGRTADDPEYWSFRWDAVRRHAHALFRYPAMMVPQMLTQLLADVRASDPDIKLISDPFVGSGTVLTEAMLVGLDFVGRDINPLAVLLSRVKSHPLHVPLFSSRLDEVLRKAAEDKGTLIEAKFPRWQKWFHRSVAIRLSRITRAIRREKDLDTRRFFWVALAETVRVSSNSRTSTYKLHIRPEEELLSRYIDPLSTFSLVAERNIKRMTSKLDLLRSTGALVRDKYKSHVTIELCDSASKSTKHGSKLADLLVTSPPYGDNESTIPYGQYSYLPLQWIDLDDIESGLDRSLIATTHTLDTRSLGGSRKHAFDAIVSVKEKSPSLVTLLEQLKDRPRDRSVRACAFWRDMDCCLSSILSGLRANAYMIWIVGNRRVGNIAVPMHSILSELIQARGGVQVHLFERRIPCKRMAIRNDISRTMSYERILVMRKGVT